ncbi:hypothetical protein NPIL_682591 [Nephila pilipes]|uniref:Uncharacterized protein n=1 Tax=Nephila pilipes TaxID=299642 RepID=A0A8X6PHM2_NEPPI|nr:hypothetical protein NPIL_682591 [Nephila pilipes]
MVDLSKQVLLREKAIDFHIGLLYRTDFSHHQLQFIAKNIRLHTDTYGTSEWYSVDQEPSQSINEETKFFACPIFLCDKDVPVKLL